MLPRDTEAAAAVSYDLIIIGGGIYGIMAALEAARRKLRPLLLERADFGGATSWNSLRIVHGGLRYLQSFDLHRFRESVPERRWFLRHFPELVSPLECLMPLYGDGLRRPGVLRAALKVNDVLSRQRNFAVRAANALPSSRVIGPDETAGLFPAVDRRGLRGGALWYDGVMTSSQRVIIEALRWATSYGARVLNYVEADSLLTNRSGAAAGIGAIDRLTGTSIEFRAPVVLNMTGPWSRTLAARLDSRLGDRPALFQPSLAFNLSLDREPPAPLALAVKPRHRKARTYFVHPWQGRTLAGTFHAPWSGPVDDCTPGDEQVEAFLSDLNSAVPGWDLSRNDILRIHPGLLPAAHEGTDHPAAREVILDHGSAGGTPGVVSVSGVKFTTARLVAEKAVRTAFPSLTRDPDALLGTERPIPAAVPSLAPFEELRRTDPAQASAIVNRLIDEESVVYADDLLLRRTDWGYDPADEHRLAPGIARLLERSRNPVPTVAEEPPAP